jgi:hypothetical protein
LESFVARARRHGTANRTQVKHFTDYASKQSLGEVHAEVCLHHHIRLNADSTSTAPAQLPNAERKRRITEVWQAHLEGFPSQAMRAVIVHRLIFSVSKEQHDALVAVGINPQPRSALQLKESHAEFAEKISSRRFHRFRLRIAS